MKAVNTVWQFILAHQLLTYYVLAVAIDKMPVATEQSSGFYKWFFGVVQVLAANWERGKRGVQGTLAK